MIKQWLSALRHPLKILISYWPKIVKFMAQLFDWFCSLLTRQQLRQMQKVLKKKPKRNTARPGKVRFARMCFRIPSFVTLREKSIPKNRFSIFYHCHAISAISITAEKESRKAIRDFSKCQDAFNELDANSDGQWVQNIILASILIKRWFSLMPSLFSMPCH